MNYDRLYALKNKFPRAALELDLLSGKVSKDTGLIDPDYEHDDMDEMQDMIELDILEILDVIYNQGHSGFSHGYLINCLIPLLKDRPITPLTGNDWEWNINVHGNDQNKRCSKVFRRKDGTAYNIDGRAFSDNGGKTWFTNKESFKDISFPCKSGDLETEYVIIDTEE